MLRKNQTETIRARAMRFGIVASEFNAKYVDGLLASALSEFKRLGQTAVEVTRVPGAFEIPVVAAALARRSTRSLDAIICFGVILRGETTHAQHIGEAVSQALALAQVQLGVPMMHGVYLFENEAQARVRCLGPEHNRGVELTRTAVKMGEIMRNLKRGKR